MLVSTELLAAAVSLCGTIAVGLWGWLAVKVIAQGGKLVELEERIQTREGVCEERLYWLRLLDTKMNEVREGVSQISGMLKEEQEQRRMGR